MRSFNRPLALGVAALGLLAVMASPAAAQRFRTFASPNFVNRATPFRTPTTIIHPGMPTSFTSNSSFTPGSFTSSVSATPTSFTSSITAMPSKFTATNSFTSTPTTMTPITTVPSAFFRPINTAPSMTFFPPTIATAARQYSRENLGFTYNPYLPNGFARQASGFVSPTRAAELATLSNPLGLNGLGYNPALSTMGYGGGFGSGYGGGGYGGGGYGGGGSGGGGYSGAGYQSPYLAASYQNGYQGAAPAQPVAAPADSNPTINIDVNDGAYQPRSITISAGTIVRWKNVGSRLHTVTSDTGIWDSQELDPGRTVSVYFAKPGTYNYHCTLHPEKMRGTIIVE